MADYWHKLLPPPWGLRQMSFREIKSCGTYFLGQICGYWKVHEPDGAREDLSRRLWFDSRKNMCTSIPAARCPGFIWYAHEWLGKCKIVCYIPWWREFGLESPFIYSPIIEVTDKWIRVQAVPELFLDWRSPCVIGQWYDQTYLATHPRFAKMWIGLKAYEGIDPEQFLRDLANHPLER